MLIFTYGTLKRGYGNHQLLAGAEFIGEAITRHKYQMLDAGFPVLLAPTGGQPGHPVKGEVYRVNSDTIKRLDRLEGEGTMYDRVRYYVDLVDGSKERVSYYVGCARYWSRHNRQHEPVKAGFLNWPEGRPNRD